MILSQQGGPVGTITINRPEILNTLTHELILALTEEINRLSHEKAIRILIITGSGEKAFVGGIDLKSMMNLDPEGAERFITDLHHCFLAIRQSEKLVIASINGYALGGGMELAASCDLRIASENALFGMPEVRFGIPSVIEAAFLPFMVGLGRAAEMIYLGEMVGAKEALQFGFVNKVVPHGQLKEATRLMAEKALENGPKAMVLQKKLIAQWMDLRMTDAVKAGIRAFGDSYRTGEPKQGMKAFIEKRKPNYE